MKDAIIAIAIIASLAMYIQWQDTKAQYEGAMEYAEGLEAAAKARETRANRDEKLKQGGADEALSDYGRDAAGILWPND